MYLSHTQYFAYEEEQKYKEGKYVLEKLRLTKLDNERFCKCTLWEEMAASSGSASGSSSLSSLSSSSSLMQRPPQEPGSKRRHTPPQFMMRARGYQLVFGGTESFA